MSLNVHVNISLTANNPVNQSLYHTEQSFVGAYELFQLVARFPVILYKYITVP